MSNWPSSSRETLDLVSELVEGIPPRLIPTYDDISYGDFLSLHLIPNTPFLLSAKNTVSWTAAQALRQAPLSGLEPPLNTSQDARAASIPNLTWLRRYAHHVVPVANTLKQQYSEFERSERPIGQVLDEWEAGDASAQGLYVKDWHLMAEIESEGRGVEEVYAVPDCFHDDWLNPPYAPRPEQRPTSRSAGDHAPASTSDFRFTYLGPPLTYTPLHRDVYGSYSWSANVVGRKVWWLFPPDRLERVKDKHGELVFDVRELEGEGGGMKILQEEGEIIFVPSGWHHQVVNLDFCISINHNFFASPTIPSVYDTLATGQARVEDSIDDVREMIIERLGTEDDVWEREWTDEVQGLLERDAGWGWRGFWEAIRDNLQKPPTCRELSPPVDLRNEWIRSVIAKFKLRREWIFLDDVRAIIQETSRYID
ncbi:hypothetical protein IAU60_006374 [Kwoniella sp. DSM 27419]